MLDKIFLPKKRCFKTKYSIVWSPVRSFPYSRPSDWLFLSQFILDVVRTTKYIRFMPQMSGRPDKWKELLSAERELSEARENKRPKQSFSDLFNKGFFPLYKKLVIFTVYWCNTNASTLVTFYLVLVSSVPFNFNFHSSSPQRTAQWTLL